MQVGVIQKGLMRLQGKVAIVTGGASGIGRSSALLFAREGEKVVVADVLDDGGNETVNRIKRTGNEDVVFVHANVGRTQDVRR